MTIPPDQTVSNRAPDDAKPVVSRPVSNRGLWFFLGGLSLAAILLFSTLEARRSASQRPEIYPMAAQPGSMITSPPPLAIPAGPYAEDHDTGSSIPPAPRLPQGNITPYPITPMPTAPRLPQTSAPAPTAIPASPAVPPAPQIIRPPVIMTSPSGFPNPSTQADPNAYNRLAGDRALASRLQNPSVTVPQGTVIQAVLETALDSERPGFARAVVSRDVRGFDGSAILIPRGSRLFGEYRSDMSDGQKRAFVNWQKLTRPDGVQVSLESPAADPLGRAGIGGKVDSHFFQRFSGAILQSILDIGVAVASRRATRDDTVIVGLPGSNQQFGGGLNVLSRSQIRPTLSVKQGSRVSVFVARDLDFSPVQ